VLAEYTGFFSRTDLGNFGFRWLHILAGIMWIGLLYYFNFVQVPAFAAFGDEGKARNIAIDKVARRALWWFRWAAVSTFVTGILITIITEDYFSEGFGKSAGGIAISLGSMSGASSGATRRSCSPTPPTCSPVARPTLPHRPQAARR
jgi:hypothetical protein